MVHKYCQTSVAQSIHTSSTLSSLFSFSIVVVRGPYLARLYLAGTRTISPNQIMLNTSVQQSSSIKNLFPLQKQFLSRNPPPLLVNLNSSYKPKKKNVKLGFFVSSIKAVAGSAIDKAVSVKVIVTVKQTSGGILSNLGIERRLDDIVDLFGKSLTLELVSTELDPKTGLEKSTIKGNARQISKDDEDVKYEAEFEVPVGFGDIGAVLVENEHQKEMFFENIILDGLPKGPVNVTCNSWVHSKHDNPQKRVFFTKKSYVPSETPAGLRRLREEELAVLRGNGKGERKTFERIYDYDVYNDLGNPDSDPSTKRPVLGGKEIPYPRRLRTGGPPCDSDPLSEKKSSTTYVPRDEAFTTVKQTTVASSAAYSLLHAVVPLLESAVTDLNAGFPSFTAIDELYNEGISLPPNEKQGIWNNILPRIFKSVVDESQNLLRFEIPETIKRDKFFWLRDEEFARQTLAGLNPFSIELVKEWPLKSKLDPEIYGPAESAITTELIEREIKGIMSFDEALKQKKLFIIDFHDILLPYVEKVRALEGRTFYGSRTIFFLNPDETLRPIAIELTRPPMDGKPQWKEVFTPTWNSTGVWLWRLAKAHATSHNAIHHQLVSHWLRTHCVVEPYIIATHRQLSEMHPIYQLLHPHFRFTIEINAAARGAIVSADGIMENSYAPGKYYMELGAGFYKDWRFDTEGLPADLIRRGLAIEDSSAPHGVKLLIKDYPYANDGLLLWDALNQWISDYVNHYYRNPRSIESDLELQSWWTEIRTIGHADKKDEPWWPDLKTPQDLISIITTIAWVASGHHAAVNYGIYDLGGYFPGWPTTARTKMPTEDRSEEEWKIFLETPEQALLQCFPSKVQAIRSITAWDLLSYHSADEEYVGGKLEAAWSEDPEIKAAFERFAARLKENEGEIDARNADGDLRNRSGAGTVPYELLKTFSEAGVTGKGVPNSITV